VVGPPIAPLIRWLLVNSAALVLCGLVLSGVRIDKPSDYLLGALGMEIPTLVWILTVSRWNLDKSALWNALPGRIVLLAFILLVPLLLMTALPALLTAEWISPGIAIDGFWTYLGACAITALLRVVAGKSVPLEYARGFLRPVEGSAAPLDQ
jgi:hypothetical protein